MSRIVVKFIIFTLILCFCSIATQTGTASEDVQRLDSTPKPSGRWEPVAAPLTTIYAKSVTPQNVHKEYPRPTMVRPKWLNLNGVWELKPQNDPLHPLSVSSETSDSLDFTPISLENRPLHFFLEGEFPSYDPIPTTSLDSSSSLASPPLKNPSPETSSLEILSLENPDTPATTSIDLVDAIDPTEELVVPTSKSVNTDSSQKHPDETDKTDENRKNRKPAPTFFRELAPTPHLLNPLPQDHEESSKTSNRLTVPHQTSRILYLGQSQEKNFENRGSQNMRNLSAVQILKGGIREEYPYRVLVPFALESSLSGLRHHFERFAYRRSFKIPKDWSDSERILLHFGAVDWESAIIINGKLVGIHRGGYDPFSFDITPFVQKNGKLDREVEHELIVSVYDPTHNGGTYGRQSRIPLGGQHSPCSGIWQTVWLEPVPELFIYDYCAVPNIDNSNVMVHVFLGKSQRFESQIVVEDTSAELESSESDATVVVEAFHEGKSIAKVYGGPGGSFLLSIPKEKLFLWTPETPHLYQLRIVLMKNGKAHDYVEGYFGMRKIDLARDPHGMVRIRLNNEFRFQMGVLDPGLWPEGIYTPPSDEAIAREIHTIRELGFNMVRKHAKIESERWYYWCDRLGLLVWQDMPGGENQSSAQKKLFEQELQTLIQTRRKHPSIVAWILFHEGKGQHDTERYVNLVHRLDPTRLIDAASGWHDENIGHIVDLHQFPGPIAPPEERFRASILGEFGGISLELPGSSWSKNSWGYRLAVDSEDFQHRYAQIMSALQELVRKQTLSAAVYHQLTDVESESSGFITYDRRIIKIPLETIRELNEKCTDSQ